MCVDTRRRYTRNLSIDGSKMEKPKVPEVRGVYRRLLPSSCIDFSSQHGKTIFTEALATGYMDCFFKLCAQFCTQDEPAYCGLTSLVMVLNALQIDPGKTWKGPWRWYHEAMLDCCTPLDTARVQGINMQQFVCLAACNNLKAVPTCASRIAGVEEFRTMVKDVCSRDDVILVCCYSRKVFGQTGDGHFSPIAGYHEGRDLVLILDTARFKYPPHWVDLATLLQAMHTLEAHTGKLRGYILVSRAERQLQPFLLRPSCDFADIVDKGQLSDAVVQFVTGWSTIGMFFTPLLPLITFVKMFIFFFLKKPNFESLEKTVDELKKKQQAAISKARGILSDVDTPNSTSRQNSPKVFSPNPTSLLAAMKREKERAESDHQGPKYSETNDKTNEPSRKRDRSVESEASQASKSGSSGSRSSKRSRMSRSLSSEFPGGKRRRSPVRKPRKQDSNSRDKHKKKYRSLSRSPSPVRSKSKRKNRRNDNKKTVVNTTKTTKTATGTKTTTAVTRITTIRIPDLTVQRRTATTPGNNATDTGTVH